MMIAKWLHSSISYGLDLVESGFDGARAAGTAAWRDQEVADSLARAARHSWIYVAAGLLAGAAGACVMRSRRFAPKMAVAGAIGGAVTSGGVMSWRARRLLGAIGGGAVKNVNATRDAHWLARHPITYA